MFFMEKVMEGKENFKINFKKKNKWGGFEK